MVFRGVYRCLRNPSATFGLRHSLHLFSPPPSFSFTMARHLLSGLGALLFLARAGARRCPCKTTASATGKFRKSSLLSSSLIYRRFASGGGEMGCSSSKADARISGDSAGGVGKQSPDEDKDYVEGVVCRDGDVGENEMKSYELAGVGRVLLVRQNGRLNAIGAKCTHYGAPLVNGALGDGRVRCQWHGACFNIATGDIEDFPGLDSLPCYQVTVVGDEVKVRARRSELETNKRLRPMVRRSPEDERSIVVIGGGPAGATCVETLRQEGFTGRVTMVCKEDCLPYDRVKVSKAMDFEIEKAEFRTMDFYREHSIEVLKNTAATSVDSAKKTVTLSTGVTLRYDRLFIATGSRAVKVDIPGADLKNVVVLRDYDHSKYTNALLTEDKEVVVLGGSFVALEAANYCVNKVKKVTVVMRDTIPFRPLLGPEVGTAVKKLFEEKGINFVTKSGLKRCLDDGNGAVGSVELNDGTTLKADLCIMGVGSRLYTDFLSGSGIVVRDDGALEVDEHLRTGTPDVFAGGDIAHAPVWSHHGEKSTIGHYPLAHYHGRIAALNMLDKPTAMKAVPYFWTMLFGKGVRYAGHGKYDDIVYAGDVGALKFVAFYLKGDEVVAASSCGMDPIVSKFAERLSQDRKLHRKDLEGDPLAWTN